MEWRNPWTLRKKENNNNDVEIKIMAAQQGSQVARNEVIEQCQPFIKKVVSEVCKRYIHESMEEFSIGLLAFNEAIDGYQAKEGAMFRTFASVVIKRRVIDYIRKEQRHSSRVAVRLDGEAQENGGYESSLDERVSWNAYNLNEGEQERVAEIQEYKDMLERFGITFASLSKKSPKHQDARENAKEVARKIAEDPDMAEELMRTKRLPIQKVAPLVNSSRKTIERNRKYIIAIVLVYIGGFTSLKSYIESERG